MRPRFTSLTLLTACAALAGRCAAQLVITADKLYTMSDAGVIENGVIVIGADGKIIAVGKASTITHDASWQTLHAVVATPGLIDARCTVGVSGLLNQKQDQDQLERSAPIQPELRAIDAYNPLDPLVAYVRSYGVTTIHTGHAPGELISGQTAIFKTRGNTVDEAVVRPVAMIAATLGPEARKDDGKSPGTRAKMVAMLRDQLIKAREYQQKLAAPATPSTNDSSQDAKPKEPPARDLRLESLVDVLNGKLPLLVTANRAQDIASVLRLADEFKIKIVLDSASESYLLTDQIKAAGVPVIVHPTMARALGEMENKSFETAGRLQAAGVLVALQGGFEAYVPKARVVLFEAGSAAGAGSMGLEPALRTITSDAAKLLRLEDRVGSLRAGLDGDVVLYSGDPLEYTTRCVGVVIEGKIESSQPQ
jgi:imidazolonepropionase-like amidohydrolase